MSKKIKQEFFEEFSIPLLKEVGFAVRLFNPGSYRMTDGENIFDYYPGSNKFFDHQKQSWSVIAGNQIVDTILNY